MDVGNLNVEDVQQLKAEKKELINNINNENNSIDAWNRYLKWTLKHFQKNKEYEEILTKFISNFIGIDMYKNDPRYVNAWLNMAEVKNDISMFPYMKSQGIGVKCATFYAAWADACEKIGKTEKAYQIYVKAEKHLAEPMELLTQLKRLFHERTQEKQQSEKTKDIEQRTPLSTVVSQVNPTLDKQKLVDGYASDKQTEVNKENLFENQFENQNHQVKSLVKQQNKINQSNNKNAHQTEKKGSGFKPEIENFLSCEQNVGQFSEEHKRIGEIHGGENPNNIRHYPVNKVYSKFGVFSLEEIWAARFYKKRKEDLRKSEEEAFEKEKLLWKEEKEREWQEKEAEMKKQLEKREKQMHQLLNLIKEKNVENEVESPQVNCADMTIMVSSVCEKLKSQQQDHLFKAEEDNQSVHSNYVETVRPPLLEEKSQMHSTKFDSSSYNQSRNYSKLSQPSPLTKNANCEISAMFHQPISSFLDENSKTSTTVNREESSTKSPPPKNTAPFTIFHDNDNEKQNDVKTSGFHIHHDPPPKKKNFCFLRDNVNDNSTAKDHENGYSKIQFGTDIGDGNENEPEFLNDFVVAGGQGDFATLQNSVFTPGLFKENGNSVFTKLQRSSEETILMDFKPDNNKISAESTSYWPQPLTNKLKLEDTCPADENQEPGSAKKLSPILEASNESDKSDKSKSRIDHETHNSVAFSNAKSFIYPSSVARKPLKDILATTYKPLQESVGHSMLPDNSSVVKPNNSKPHFPTFHEENATQSTKVEIKNGTFQCPLLSDLTDTTKTNFGFQQEMSLNRLESMGLDLTNEVELLSIDIEENTDFVVAPMKSLMLEENSDVGRELSDQSLPEKLNIVNDPWEDRIIEKILKESCLLEDTTQFDHKMPFIKKGTTIDLGNDNMCTLFEVIGTGGFAKVHKAVNKKTNKEYALKIQQPPFPWETYITQETKRRFKTKGLDQVIEQIMDISTTILFTNSSLIVSDLLSSGTLLNLVTKCEASRTKPRTSYYTLTCEIMSVVHALHSVGIIHGDIKPDNFLVMNGPYGIKLKLIDFGRAIDMQAFPSSTAFIKNCGTSGFVCSQMEQNKPWNYHIDFFGIAGTVHVMLFNLYMKTCQKDGVWRTMRKRPRYSSENYDVLFSALLNFKTPSESWCPTIEDSPLPSLIKLFSQN